MRVAGTARGVIQPIPAPRVCRTRRRLEPGPMGLERTEDGERTGVPYIGWLLVALITADVAFAFQQTAVIPAIPVIEKASGLSEQWSAWLLSGYLLVAAITTPVMGRLADRYGHRRMLIVALAVFLLGSVGATMSGTVGVIAFRALQGIGGAVFPLSLAVVRDRLPAGRLARAAGALTGAFGMGSALGLGLGGWLAVTFTWRAVFGLGAIVVAAALALVLTRLPPGPEGNNPAHIDVTGAGLLCGTLAAILLPITLGTQLGWTSPPVFILLITAVIFGALWVRRELRVEDPIIDLRTLRAPSILRANLATFALGYALFGAYFLIPRLVQDPSFGFGLDAALAGAFLAPSAIGQLIAGPAAGYLSRHYAAKWPFLGGMVLVAAALAVIAGPPEPIAVFLVLTFVFGCGAGAVISTSSNLVTRDAAAERAGESTALNTTMRRLGGGFGGQISAGIVAALTTGHGPAHAAFTISLLVSAALCALGAAAAATIPRAARTPADEVQA